MPRVMPGNEAQAVLGTFRNVNPAALHALEIQFGVNSHQGVISSYFEYLGNILTGQFGVTAQGVPVMTEITQKLPWTLVLLGVSIAVVLELCGIPSLPFAVGELVQGLPVAGPLDQAGHDRGIEDAFALGDTTAKPVEPGGDAQREVEREDERRCPPQERRYPLLRQSRELAGQ